jgi:hypothetical protein
VPGPSAAVSVAMGGYGHTPSSAPPPGLMPASVPYDMQVSRAMPGVGAGAGVGVGSGIGGGGVGIGGSLSSPVPIHGSVTSSGSGPHNPRPNRAMSLRELPRPLEMTPTHTALPSPHALQLGPPDSFRPRLNSAGERMFGPGHALSSPGPGSISGGPSDRFSPDRRGSGASVSTPVAGLRDREMGSVSGPGAGAGAGAGYSDLRNSSTPGEPR